jgi:hypothetical protein
LLTRKYRENLRNAAFFTLFYAFVLLADHTPWAINAVVAAPAQSLFAAGFAGLGCGIVAN